MKCPKCGSEAARITAFGVPAKYVLGPCLILFGVICFCLALDALNDGRRVLITLASLAGAANIFTGVMFLIQKPTWTCKQCNNKFNT